MLGSHPHPLDLCAFQDPEWVLPGPGLQSLSDTQGQTVLEK